jgi:hypothetical protein
MHGSSYSRPHLIGESFKTLWRGERRTRSEIGLELWGSFLNDIRRSRSKVLGIVYSKPVICTTVPIMLGRVPVSPL